MCLRSYMLAVFSFKFIPGVLRCTSVFSPFRLWIPREQRRRKTGNLRYLRETRTRNSRIILQTPRQQIPTCKMRRTKKECIHTFRKATSYAMQQLMTLSECLQGTRQVSVQSIKCSRISVHSGLMKDSCCVNCDKYLP